MRNLGLVVAVLMLLACSPSHSQEVKANSRAKTNETSLKALSGDWGLVNMSCASGRPISRASATVVSFKSTVLSIENNMSRISMDAGPCSMETFNTFKIQGGQLVYAGGKIAAISSCEGRSIKVKQGISEQSADSFSIRGDQLIIRSPSTGVICPTGDTTISTYLKLFNI